MNERKISISVWLLVLFGVSSFSSTIFGKRHHARQSEQKSAALNLEQSDELELFGTEEELDPLDDPNITKYVQHKTFKAPTQKCSAQDILNTIVPLGMSDLLEQNIFCHTNPLNNRNLDDEPLFLPHVFQYPQDLTVSTCIFWNQTDKMNFTSSSNSFDCYLALTNPMLLSKLPPIEALLKGFDLARILTLFGTAHVEERRVGTSLQAVWQSQFGDLRAFLPIYYFERNFNMTESVKAELAALTFEPSPGEQERFKKEHLISDNLGIGDLRLEWLLPLVDRETYALKTGIYTTLPTSWAFAKNIKGSSYCSDAPRPKVNLEALCQNRDLKNITDALFYSLDHLAANLIDAKANTQQRHFSIAGMVQTKASLNSLIHRPWAEHFSLHNRTSLEYFTPGWEKRFYVLRADCAEFARFDKYKNGQGGPETAPEDLAFLENRLVDVIYPYVFDTLVKPNFVFWWDAKAQYEYANMGGFLGVDFWLKGKEQFGSIRALPNVYKSLEIEKARKPLAYQMKVLGSLFYKMEQPNYECIISFNADKAFLHSGIGKDYNLVLQFETSF